MTQFNKFFIAISILSLFSCSNETTPSKTPKENASTGISEDTELRFEATGSGGTTGGAPWGLCDMLGPHNSLVLAEVTAKPSFEPKPEEANCDQMKYQQATWTLPVTLVDTALPPAPGDADTDMIFFNNVTDGEFYDHVADPIDVGDRILASIRQSDGTWFVDRWIYAHVGTNDAVGTFPIDDTATVVDIPSTWGELVTRAGEVKSDYAAACPDYSGPDGPMDRDDASYHDYRYPPPYDCSGVGPGQDANSNEGDTNNAN